MEKVLLSHAIIRPKRERDLYSVSSERSYTLEQLTKVHQQAAALFHIRLDYTFQVRHQYGSKASVPMLKFKTGY